VDFELSDDQVALRDGAQELLYSLSSSERVRVVVDGPDPYDSSLWSAMADQGWMALEVPEDEGGLGLGLVEVAVLCEQVGRHCAPAPFRSSILALGALRRADLEGVRAAAPWLEPLASGEAIGAAAWSRQGSAVTARRQGGAWLLSGRSDPSLYVPVADVVVLSATDDEGRAALFAIELDGSTRPEPEPAMDRTRVVGWLELAEVNGIRLGGEDAVAALLERGAAVTSAEMLGGADRVLEMSVAYAKDRVQFGRPIGSFQAVKHRCADMLVDVEGMRSTAYYAAWAVGAQADTPGSDRYEASLAASTAKAWCSDAGRRVMASGLQVHGGIGFTWEHDLHLYLKRSQLDQTSFGDAGYHRDRIATYLRSRVEAGESIL
jgi:alkylation response protein AidB-like acyl-CoA dehydrogenase